MGIIKVHTEADFDKYIKSGKTTIVDFFAEWCGPCKMISPYFEELSNKYDTIQFVKIDVDELNDVSGKCGVRAMPTFQLYKDGAKADELVGANKDKLLELVEKNK